MFVPFAAQNNLTVCILSEELVKIQPPYVLAKEAQQEGIAHIPFANMDAR
jgi:hypothetical protein